MTRQEAVTRSVVQYIHAEVKSGELKGKRKNIYLPFYFEGDFRVLIVKKLRWDRKKDTFGYGSIQSAPITEDEYYQLCRKLVDYVKEDH